MPLSIYPQSFIIPCETVTPYGNYVETQMTEPYMEGLDWALRNFDRALQHQEESWGGTIGDSWRNQAGCYGMFDPRVLGPTFTQVYAMAELHTSKGNTIYVAVKDAFDPKTKKVVPRLTAHAAKAINRRDRTGTGQVVNILRSY